MSAYDTVDRDDEWSVRVYCEVPTDVKRPVMCGIGTKERGATAYMSTDDAIRFATALLNAAARAHHAMKVDGVLKGTLTSEVHGPRPLGSLEELTSRPMPWTYGLDRSEKP